MPHHRPRVAQDTRASHSFTAVILLLVLCLGGWALHGGASEALNAAKLFGR